MTRATDTPFRSRFSIWAALCLALVAGAAAEGLHFAIDEQALTPFAAVVNVGFFAPVVLVAATALTVITAAWLALGWLPASPREGFASLRRWAYLDPPEALANRSAALLAGGASAALFLGGSFLVGTRILAGVARPAMGLGLILGIQLALLAACVAGFAAAFWFFRGALRALARRAPRAAVAPLSFLGATVLTGVLGGAALATTDVGAHLPWHLVSGAVGCGVGLIVGALLARRWPYLLAAGSVAIVSACLALTISMPEGQRQNRALLTGLSPIASPLFAALEPRLDFDDDGSIHLFGGRDCAPHNPDAHPGALERLNNGIDEDCSGADLTHERIIEEAAVSYGRPDAVTKRPHVFLITTDSLSMDHTSLGRTDRDTTPELARFAKDAIVFDNAFALGPSTRLALPGLLAGIYNSMNDLKPEGGQPFGWGESSPTLASKLKMSGYRTVQIIPHHFFSRRWKDGASHGFDVKDTQATKRPKDPAHTAPEVTERVIAHIEKAAAEQKPTFMWAHYYDHHSPFRQPVDGVVYGTTKADVFDSELNFADRHWGRVFDALEANFEPDEYIVIFTSDHGEAFDEFHPKRHHGYDLRTPVLHVPLIIRAGTPGRRVDGLATHADVPPTVADIAGVSRDPAWVGESLVPVIYQGAQPKKSVVYGLLYVPERVTRGRDPFAQLSVRTHDFYYEIDYDADSERLTNWRVDPIGRDELGEAQHSEAELMRYLAALKLSDLRDSERALRGTKLDATAESEAESAPQRGKTDSEKSKKRARSKKRNKDEERP